MDGCLPCICGSIRLIPNVYIGNPTCISIYCIDCEREGGRGEDDKKAILAWNSMIVELTKPKITP